MVALGFFVAYFTEDEALTVHVWAGYVVGVLVLLRIIWGFVGPRHARFTDFTYRPSTVLAYLRDLMLARAPRYIGHSPAGGSHGHCAIALLSMTVATGSSSMPKRRERDLWLLSTLKRRWRVLAPAPMWSWGERKAELSVAGEGALSKSSHEAIANVTLALVIFHILGVVLASFVHHENFSRAMVTGRKRRE